MNSFLFNPVIILSLFFIIHSSTTSSPCSLVGLITIAIGTGGIKPCVSAFGGDQFQRPQQEKQLEQFFSVFYFAINAGSLISTYVTPYLREKVHCFGQESCFPLAFGVPAILMIVALGKFSIPYYPHRPIIRFRFRFRLD